MRQISLDTETTGRDAAGGDRVVEIGCVELVGRSLSDNPKYYFHLYLNPERDVPEEVVRIHGLTRKFLEDKPVFADVADSFLDFIKGAELIIHNAEFYVGFLNAELNRVGKGKLENYCSKITDTLAIARTIFPGLRNNLDILCSRYEIDNSSRTLHGALLDAHLLAEVYLAMTRKQESLLGELSGESDKPDPIPKPEAFIAAQATSQEIAEHEAFLDRIDKKCKTGALWRTQSRSVPSQTTEKNETPAVKPV